MVESHECATDELDATVERPTKDDNTTSEFDSECSMTICSCCSGELIAHCIRLLLCIAVIDSDSCHSFALCYQLHNTPPVTSILLSASRFIDCSNRISSFGFRSSFIHHHAARDVQ